MFNFYKKHNNKLYNKLVELSRNKFFYKETKLSDTFETRILLIFFHLGIIFNSKKNGVKNKKKNQEIFDSIFINIENHIRELGYGDVSVNKKMKILNQIFYDILVKQNQTGNFFDSNDKLIKKYFFNNDNDQTENISKLVNYFNNFYNFCFDLDPDSVINGSINFIHRH